MTKKAKKDKPQVMRRWELKATWYNGQVKTETCQALNKGAAESMCRNIFPRKNNWHDHKVREIK